MESLEESKKGPRLLRVVTRCATAHDFIITFGPFVQGDTIFIGTRSPRPVGQRQPCMIVLKDGRVLLRGDAEVMSVHGAGDGPEGHAGMRIKFVQLDDSSKRVHADLLEQAKILQNPDDKTPLLPLMPEEPSPLRRLASSPRRKAARSATLLGMPLVPLPSEGSGPTSDDSAVIPANPLGAMDDQALGDFVEGAIVDCAIYEETSRYTLTAPDDGLDEDEDQREDPADAASTTPLPASPPRIAPSTRPASPPPARAKTPVPIPPVRQKTPLPRPISPSKTPVPVLPGMAPSRSQVPLPGMPERTPPPSSKPKPDPAPEPALERTTEGQIPLSMSVPVNDLVDMVSGPIGPAPDELRGVVTGVLAPPTRLPPISLPGMTNASAADTDPIPASETAPLPGHRTIAGPPAQPAAAFANTEQLPAVDDELGLRRRGAPRFPIPMAAITLGAFLLGLGTGWLIFGQKDSAPTQPVASTPPVTAPPPSPAPPETATPPSPAPSPSPSPEAEPDAPEEPETPAANIKGSGLELKSTPSGAVFYVNGKKVGKAPLVVAQKKGKLKIVALKPGYKRWVRNMWHTSKLTAVHAKMAKE